MPRIKIDLPDAFIFNTSVQIRVTDLNYGNHLGNDALLGLIHEARVQFLQSLGCKNEKNVFGAGLIMADTAIQYKAEGFLGDQLKIEVEVYDITRMGFDIGYRITRGSDVIALAKTGMVCFDYSNRKVTAVPEELLSALANCGR